MGDEYRNDLPVSDDWHGGEHLRGKRRRHIERVILDDRLAAIRGVQGAPCRPCESGLGEGAMVHIAAKIDFLVDAIDDVARLRVHQVDVPEADRVVDALHDRVIAGVGYVVARPAGRGVELESLAVFIRVAGDVVRLQTASDRVDGQQAFERRVAASDFIDAWQEILVVPGGERNGVRSFTIGVCRQVGMHVVERRNQRPGGSDRFGGATDCLSETKLVTNIGLDALLLDFALCGELLGNRAGQRRGAGSVADQAPGSQAHEAR